MTKITIILIVASVFSVPFLLLAFGPYHHGGTPSGHLMKQTHLSNDKISSTKGSVSIGIPLGGILFLDL